MDSIARRSTVSVLWREIANVTGTAVLFARSILLARLLPVETFGVYAYASAMVGMTAKFASLGISSAFLHRAPETEDEGRAAAAHFTLKVVLATGWAVGLGLFALLTTRNETRLALLVLIVATALSQLNETPRIILIRRVVHRRLALVNITQTLMGSGIAVLLAWQHAGIWALLATNIVNVVVGLTLFYLWRPVWKPHLAWLPRIQRYLLVFGSRVFVGTLLARAIDRVDDLWTGTYLGKTALGFYSRAYAFATYPRRIIASPIEAVVRGTYAELKGDRPRLSQAFFRTNALIIRTGFVIAAMFSLMAPTLIRVLIGEKWLPMLDAFRIMLLFTLFDPIRTTTANLFVAVGSPELVIKARIVQLVTLVVSLFALGSLWGIAGVALAVDIMLVVGIGLLLWFSRDYVDYSLRKLVLPPALALLFGGAGVWATGQWMVALSDVAGGVLFGVIYVASLVILEPKEVARMLAWGRRLVARPIDV